MIGRKSVSRTTKLDFCGNNRDVYYIVYNHRPSYESSSDDPQPVFDFMNGAFPNFALGSQCPDHKTAECLCWCQDHSRSFNDFVPGFKHNVYEEINSSLSPHPSRATISPHPILNGSTWSSRSESTQAMPNNMLHERGRRCPSLSKQYQRHSIQRATVAI